jgi:hypothetical protein
MHCDTIQRARMASVRSSSWNHSRTDGEYMLVNIAPPCSKRRRSIAAYCFVVCSCIFSTGCCRVLGLAYRTTIAEPRAYCTNCDRQASLELYSAWADQAWREQSEACATAILQPDYAAGFHDGFVDYVFAGGTGEPPPVPPRIFWNASLRTADGKQRAEQWFEGYRHGSRVAREGGYREVATVHGSVAVRQSNSRSLADSRETSRAVGGKADAPERVEGLPEPGASSGKNESAKPPASNESEIRPADLPLTSGDMPTNDATGTSRQVAPVPPVPAANKSAGDSKTKSLNTVPEPKSAPTDGTKEEKVEPIVRPGPANQGAVPLLNQGQPPNPFCETPPELGRPPANVGIASDAAGSAVCFISGSKDTTLSTCASSSMPAASQIKCDNPEAQCPATQAKAATAPSTDSAAAQHATESPAVKQVDDTPSPLLTPRARAASAVLFQQ